VGGETVKSKMLGVEVSHPLCMSIRKIFGGENLELETSIELNTTGEVYRELKWPECAGLGRAGHSGG